ncbi:MAG: mandelate racemase/muconate lactonizing enzyme family protein [Cellvibrionaceae bacterium]
MNHKIISIEFTWVRAPLDKPVSAAGMSFTYRDYLLCKLLCDDGTEGIGFSYVGVGGGRSALYAASDLFGDLVVGRNPDNIESIWQAMYNATLIQGRAGIVMNALSAIDIALWDRKARSLKQPLCHLLGGHTDKPVKAYASGGYYAEGKGLEELKEEAQSWVNAGFTAVKIKAGKLSLKEEEQRVAAVRDAIGDECLLMLDLYNAMENIGEAVQFADMYKHYNPYWIEDPFKPDDIENFTRLSSKVSTPLATGEFHYSLHTFKTIIESGAAQVIQAEAPRVGGITQWRKIANLVDACGAVVNPCWFHQLHAQLLPSISGGEFVEYFPDNAVLNFNQLICNDGMHLNKKGQLLLSQSHGLGFDFDTDGIDELEHETLIVRS